MSDKIAAATKAIEDAVSTAKQNVEGIVKTQQEQIEKASAQLLKGYEDLTSLTKGNVDAVVKSGTIVAKGAEEAGKRVAAFAQSSLEKNIADSKALFSVKSFQELIALQGSLVKANLESLIAESTKLNELTVKVANEALAPLSDRVNLAVGKLVKPIAA